MEIEKITVNKEFYPRTEHSKTQVALYRQSLDQLPSIEINKNNVLVDGYHRMQAYREEGKLDIPVVVVDIPDDQILVESIRRNAQHGLQLSGDDKRRLAPILYANGMPNIDEIATLLSAHRNSILNWTQAIREKETTEEDRIIWEMWLACKTQDEIAKKLKIPRKTIADRIGEIHKNVEIANPIPLHNYNIWNFSSCDEQFGIEYPGRIPGQVLQHVLYYYTEPFNVVMDLFGGGGTTIDVCKSMARRYRVYDIKPVRDDIIKHDSITGLPGGSPKPNLIFLDPPYWSQRKGDYSDDQSNLANLSLDGFTHTLSNIILQSLKAVKPSGHVALIIGNTQKDGKFYDHTLNLKIDANLVQRIIVPYPTQQYTGADVKRVQDGKIMLNLYRDLLIWQT